MIIEYLERPKHFKFTASALAVAKDFQSHFFIDLGK